MSSHKMSTFRQDYVPYPAMPIGTVLFIAYTIPPDGWLECNGQAISRTIYSYLFSKLGTLYGSGDGINTFNLPDLRGEFIRGWDNSKGVDSGRTFGTNQTDDVGNVDVPVRVSNYASSTAASYYSSKTALAAGIPSATSDSYTGQGTLGTTTLYTNNLNFGGTETRPRNVALMPIIKVLNIAGYDPQVNIVGNADTLDGLHASDFVAKTESLSKGIAFGLMYPYANQESCRYIAKRRMRLTDVMVVSTTTPTASTQIQVYKNSIAIAEFSLTTPNLTVDINPEVDIPLGSVLYVKINGAVNGITNITIELSVI